ncbi:MAG: ASCH domain-containing protein [Erysipelotrichaceae bacterium]|nr:ASCH domain-containing protein [Erysipelotrichaceae bacterium]
MSKILISIKPKYVEKIFNGSKKYEYRTKLAKKDVDKLIVYCTSPVKRVIGEVDVTDTITCSPERLWEETSEYSGVSKTDFDNYFEKRSDACAYVLGKITRFKKPKLLEEYGIEAAPQTYYYL